MPSLTGICQPVRSQQMVKSVDVNSACRFLTMGDFVEQRICLKFCVTNEFSCADALKMLQKAFGNNAISKTLSYAWYKAFKDGREVVEDLPRSGRTSTASTGDNVDNIKETVLENRHTRLKEIALKLNISHESARTILIDILGMSKVAARLVPKELNFLQKRYREQVASDKLDHFNSDFIFMERIITAPCDFFLFPKLKLPLRGPRFESIKAKNQNSARELKAIPESAYKNVSMNGNAVGIDVLEQMVPILKATQ